MILARSSARILSSCYIDSCRYGSKREIKRWVAPVMREFNKRKKKVGPGPVRPRSSFVDWNYNAELFAFNKRLREDFDLGKLQRAFVHQSFIMQEEAKQKALGVEEPTFKLEGNQELIAGGELLIKDHVSGFLQHCLPKMRPGLLDIMFRNVTSDSALAEIASNLGMEDLILSSDSPLQKATLADTFKAVVGALRASCGEEKAYTFIRDFVCTELNQRDLSELCVIDNPFEELTLVCKQAEIGVPEARLIGESAKRTVLAVCNVGIYCDRKLVGSGFGENIDSAVNDAAYNALREIWGFPENLKPFNFEIPIESASTEKLKSAG